MPPQRLITLIRGSSKVAHNWNFLGSFVRTAHMAENWFLILEIRLRHPLFFLLCELNGLLVQRSSESGQLFFLLPWEIFPDQFYFYFLAILYWDQSLSEDVFGILFFNTNDYPRYFLSFQSSSKWNYKTKHRVDSKKNENSNATSKLSWPHCT